MQADQRIRLAIHGSCVSRDTCDLALGAKSSVRSYVARQSIISVDQPTDNSYLRQLKFPSDFKQKSFTGDLLGDAFIRLSEASEVDLLLLDLVDERLGLFVSPEGEVITQSTDGRSISAYNNLPWGLIEFGTAEHFMRFKSAWVHYSDRLKELNLFERTVLIQAPWAVWDSNGQRALPDTNDGPKYFNRKYKRYYRLIKNSGVRVIKVPKKILHCRRQPPLGVSFIPLHTAILRIRGRTNYENRPRPTLKPLLPDLL